MTLEERELEEMSGIPDFDEREPTEEELNAVEQEVEAVWMEDASEDEEIRTETDAENDRMTGADTEDTQTDEETEFEKEKLPDDLLTLYMQQVRSIPLLSEEEMMRLAEIIQRGKNAERTLEPLLWNPEALPPEEQAELEKLVAAGERAKQKLTEGNLRLVLSTARKYKGRGLSMGDLIQEGSLGVIMAAGRFDPSKGKFSTYAMYWIVQKIRKAILDQNPIRFSDNAAGDLRKVKATATRLTQELGHEPSAEEIAAELGKPVEWVRAVKGFDRSTVSLDAPVGEDGDAEVGDFVTDEREDNPLQIAEKTALHRSVQKVLDTLPDIERQVICLRYGFDCHEHEVDEIAEVLGKDEAWVRKIEQNGQRN